MKALRSALVAALLVAPVLSLNAGTLSTRTAPPELQATHSLAGTCVFYYNGTPYYYPC
jgi:hypothetical protein